MTLSVKVVLRITFKDFEFDSRAYAFWKTYAYLTGNPTDLTDLTDLK